MLIYGIFRVQLFFPQNHHERDEYVGNQCSLFGS